MSIKCIMRNEINFVSKEELQDNPYAIRYLDGQAQTEELCLIAVKQDGEVLEYVKKPTDKIILEAIKQNGRAIWFVKEQTYELCLTAVKNTPQAIKDIRNTTIRERIQEELNIFYLEETNDNLSIIIVKDEEDYYCYTGNSNQPKDLKGLKWWIFDIHEDDEDEDYDYEDCPCYLWGYVEFLKENNLWMNVIQA